MGVGLLCLGGSHPRALPGYRSLPAGFPGPLAVISLSYGLLLHHLALPEDHHGGTGGGAGLLHLLDPLPPNGLILASEPPRSPLFGPAQRAEPFIIALGYVNSCINPVISLIAGQDFRAKVCPSLVAVLQNVLSEEALQPSSHAESGKRSTSTTTEDRSACTTV